MMPMVMVEVRRSWRIRPSTGCVFCGLHAALGG